LQTARTAAGSLQPAKPLSSSAKVTPASVSWRLAHPCPLTETRTVRGAYVHIRMEQGPNSGSRI
jgi:hypothetical protein